MNRGIERWSYDDWVHPHDVIIDDHCLKREEHHDIQAFTPVTVNDDNNKDKPQLMDFPMNEGKNRLVENESCLFS